MCICDNCEMCNPTVIYEEYSLGGTPFSETYLRERDGWHCLYNGEESVNKDDLSQYGCRLK